MKIDLHNHTTTSSQCSILDVRDLITQAQKMGLDAVCVTEHNTLYGGKVAENLGVEMGFLVIAGQEVSTADGDILAFGMQSEGLQGIAVVDLCELAKKENAVLIPAHPYRAWGNGIDDLIFAYAKYFVAIEGLNPHCSDDENKKAVDGAKKIGLPITAGSDAHAIESVGQCYTEFNADIKSIDDLVEVLRGRDYTAKRNLLYKVPLKSEK
jgi:predicted metal-dependent phosphoesterase TrpH